MFNIHDDYGMCSSDFSKQQLPVLCCMFLMLTVEDSGSFFQYLLVFSFHLYSNSLLPEYEHHICIKINYTPVLFTDFAWVLTLPRGPLTEI